MEIISEIEKKYPIVADLVKNILKIEKKFAETTYEFASTVKFVSPRLHKIMVKEMGLPSEYNITKFQNSSEMIISKFYLDQSKIGEIIRQYKIDNKILQHYELHSCLSVDALFFNPEVKISPKNEACGILLSEQEMSRLPSNAASLFNSMPDLFESFLRYYHKK